MVSNGQIGDGWGEADIAVVEEDYWILRMSGGEEEYAHGGVFDALECWI